MSYMIARTTFRCATRRFPNRCISRIGSVSQTPLFSTVLRRLGSTLDYANAEDVDFEEQWQQKYNVWKEGKGPPPKDLLLDASGNEVIRPNINPDFRIRGQDGELPPELQHAIDQHVYWASQHEYRIPKDRNIARHWRLDSRSCLKKAKKAARRKDLVVTPFLLIGAYQNLLRRAQQYPYGDDEEDVAGSKLRTADIRFSWFQTLSRVMSRVEGVSGHPILPAKSHVAYTDARALILNETMAMLMHPIVKPFLPSHSWFLNSMNLKTGILGDGWKFVPGTQRVEVIARKTVEYDTRRHSILLWDLGVDGEVVIDVLQMKMIGNMATPYASPWWLHDLNRIFNLHGRGAKKKKKWTVTDDKYSSLPSLLVDMLLMRLDYSDTLKSNPLYRQIREAQRSDRKKQKIGVVDVKNVPKTLDKSDAHADYHRYGTTVCFMYKGPQKLKDKLTKAVSLELKSSLQYDKKLIDNRSFQEKKPSRKMTAQEKKELKQAEEKFAEQSLRVDVAIAGTGRTRNSKRVALQEIGRELKHEGRLDLDKTGAVKERKVRTPKDAEMKY